VDPLGLNGCPGDDGCKKPTLESIDPTKKIKGGEEDSSRSVPQQTYLYRGSGTDPSEIFENGFKSKGNSKDLFLHSIDSEFPPSNFISTSLSREMGKAFATSYFTRPGFLYTLNMIPGHDLKKELGASYRFSKEQEIAIPGQIKREDILGATLIIDDGREFGYSIPNPHRKINK
jgi:hypothetical protein